MFLLYDLVRCVCTCTTQVTESLQRRVLSVQLTLGKCKRILYDIIMICIPTQNCNTHITSWRRSQQHTLQGVTNQRMYEFHCHIVYQYSYTLLSFGCDVFRLLLSLLQTVCDCVRSTHFSDQVLDLITPTLITILVIVLCST